MSDQKVFGIGFGKTGTTSLARGLRILEYEVFDHQTLWYPPKRVRHFVDRAIAENVSPLTKLPGMRKYSAFTDVKAITLHYEYFDENFPGSKFILHTRDFDSWWSSRLKHIERKSSAGIKVYRNVRDDNRDRDLWYRFWSDHHENAREYFSRRPADFLEVDVTAGDGWDVLAPFLERPTPTVEFPVMNTAQRDSMRVAQVQT